MSFRPVRKRVAATVLALGAAAGCGSGDDPILVLAASSLTEVFEQLEADYESSNPGIDVVVSFAGSSTLAAAIEQGAPADVFASANGVQMQRVVEDVAGAPETFARNRLAIAVERGNPRAISGLADLADPDLVVVLAAPDVPVGAYADAALAGAGVTVAPDSLEQSARAVASKVALGEADAGIVYRTDVMLDDRVDEVVVPDVDNVVADYPIVAVTGGAARDFVAFVLGPNGRSVLVAAGFEVP